MELTLVVGHTYPYGFGFDSLVPMEVREWCHETFDGDRCHVGRWNVAFKNESDRDWFILRWG